MAFSQTFPHFTESQLSNSDRGQIEKLTQQWVNLWSPKNKPFTGEGFDRIFATGENEILVFDNFNNSIVVLRSLRDYLNTWIPIMQQFVYWEIAIENNLEISIDGDLAVTTFSFAGGGKNRDGEDYKLRQYCTHTWKRINAAWQLVGEHLTVAD